MCSPKKAFKIRATIAITIGDIASVLNICHFNAEGLSIIKSEYIAKVLHSNHFDVIALQETHVEDMENSTRGIKPRYRLVVSIGHRAYGVAMYVKQGVDNVTATHKGRVGNIFVLAVKVAQQSFAEKELTQCAKITTVNQHECLLKRITPYYNIPYASELEFKQQSALRVVKTIKDGLEKLGTKLPRFPIERIVPSPEVKQYRNKDDFTIYRGVDGEATVGYLSGTPKVSGCVAVRPTHLAHIRDSHKRMAKLLEDYIRQSPHRVCFEFGDGGFWKRFEVRSNDTGHLMATIITHPHAMPKDDLAQERANLTNYFIEHEPDLILYHQECEKVDCRNDLKSYIQLAGKTPYLVETMGNKKFQISPHSFFQINKIAAEKMVDKIWNEMDVNQNSTFLDMYSGVGLYSIMGSHRVRNAVGIEMIDGAVNDAKKNAKINNITNCNFISGRVEASIKTVLSKSASESQHLMTLMNPGRAGATKKVIALLRKEKRINRLVYVSCKPDNRFTSNNFIQLCRKGGDMGGVPFQIDRIQLFDLFPRTEHYEMVLEFSREERVPKKYLS